MTALALLVSAESRAWRRRLGAMAWAALEHLALAAQWDEAGWASPVGVRDVAAGLGVTKDTAARAVATLVEAGLVTLTRVETPDGRRRSGYRLQLPAGILFRRCPDWRDTAAPQGDPDRCPNHRDDRQRPTERDSTPAAIPAPSGQKGGATRVQRQAKRYASTVATAVSQPALFDVDPGATKLIEEAT